MFSRILLPLDGSPTAEQAIDPACDLAALVGAPVHLVRALDPEWMAAIGSPFSISAAPDEASMRQMAENDRSIARAYLRQVAARISARELPVTMSLVNGRAEVGIISETRGGDVIVMTTHGRGGLTRLLLGSVADIVVRQSPVPVLLIRADISEGTSLPGDQSTEDCPLSDPPGAASGSGRIARPVDRVRPVDHRDLLDYRCLGDHLIAADLVHRDLGPMTGA